jgi:hypothetical protein
MYTCNCCTKQTKFARSVAGFILCTQCHLRLHKYNNLILLDQKVRLVLEYKQDHQPDDTIKVNVFKLDDPKVKDDYIQLAKDLGCTPVNGWDVMSCPWYERLTDVGSYIVSSNRMLLNEFITLYEINNLHKLMK